MKPCASSSASSDLDSEHQRELAEYLIGSLDDDGLLRKSLDSISDELAIYAGIDASPEELEEVLRDYTRLRPRRIWAPAPYKSACSSRFDVRKRNGPCPRLHNTI